MSSYFLSVPVVRTSLIKMTLINQRVLSCWWCPLLRCRYNKCVHNLSSNLHRLVSCMKCLEGQRPSGVDGVNSSPNWRSRYLPHLKLPAGDRVVLTGTTRGFWYYKIERQRFYPSSIIYLTFSCHGWCEVMFEPNIYETNTRKIRGLIHNFISGSYSRYKKSLHSNILDLIVRLTYIVDLTS